MQKLTHNGITYLNVKQKTIHRIFRKKIGENLQDLSS